MCNTQASMRSCHSISAEWFLVLLILGDDGQPVHGGGGAAIDTMPSMSYKKIFSLKMKLSNRYNISVEHFIGLFLISIFTNILWNSVRLCCGYSNNDRKKQSDVSLTVNMIFLRCATIIYLGVMRKILTGCTYSISDFRRS